MASILYKFLSLSNAKKKITLEAFFTLLICKVQIHLFGVKSACKNLGILNQSVEIPFTDSMRDRAQDVKFGILAAKSKMPWHSVCLDQSLACATLLHRRHVPYKLCFGVQKKDSNKLDAHSWIECDQTILIGGSRSKNYQMTIYFSNSIQVQSNKFSIQK